MLIPDTERETLASVMDQVERDLKSAHAEIVKLQGGDPEKYEWPEWSPQANTLRWFAAIREKFYGPSSRVALAAQWTNNQMP